MFKNRLWKLQKWTLFGQVKPSGDAKYYWKQNVLLFRPTDLLLWCRPTQQ